jgi:hypothetical protein
MLPYLAELLTVALIQFRVMPARDGFRASAGWCSLQAAPSAA